tara:strand:- start:9104 stop:9418 length:315 start_codon:yes stop_codon:yes gene_type:complete
MAYDFSKVMGIKGRSNEAMLLEWFKSRKDALIGAHEIQLNAVQYIRNMFNKPVTPDTISRLWRKMREDYRNDKENSALYRSGLTYDEVMTNRGTQKYYKVSDAD